MDANNIIKESMCPVTKKLNQIFQSVEKHFKSNIVLELETESTESDYFNFCIEDEDPLEKQCEEENIEVIIKVLSKEKRIDMNSIRNEQELRRIYFNYKYDERCYYNQDQDFEPFFLPDFREQLRMEFYRSFNMSIKRKILATGYIRPDLNIHTLTIKGISNIVSKFLHITVQEIEEKFEAKENAIATKSFFK